MLRHDALKSTEGAMNPRLCVKYEEPIFILECPIEVQTHTLMVVSLNMPMLSYPSACHKMTLCRYFTGYEGAYCEQETDECLDAPCIHSTNCTDLVNDYVCHCMAGYTGKDCGHEIDECDSQPCLHDSTCNDRVRKNLNIADVVAVVSSTSVWCLVYICLSWGSAISVQKILVYFLHPTTFIFMVYIILYELQIIWQIQASYDEMGAKKYPPKLHGLVVFFISWVFFSRFKLIEVITAAVSVGERVLV